MNLWAAESGIYSVESVMGWLKIKSAIAYGKGQNEVIHIRGCMNA